MKAISRLQGWNLAIRRSSVLHIFLSPGRMIRKDIRMCLQEIDSMRKKNNKTITAIGLQEIMKLSAWRRTGLNAPNIQN